MIDSIDDIARQARQGSVSAIIQVLNDKLADSGVRTRAILANSVLQLLCEAATPEQLEQHILVERVRQILESLHPRNIRRININSRIVREQQLLWLDEITRDPENQLLWSEEIVLSKPNLVQQWLQDRRDSSLESARSAYPKAVAPRKDKDKGQFVRGIIGGVSLSLLLLLLGWGISDWLGLDLGSQIQAFTSRKPEEPEPEAAETPAPSPSTSPIATSVIQQDPFVQAVRLAEQAVADGQQAKTPADWLDLATRWQRASDLMAQVSPDDGRYVTAQNRTLVYRQNSQSALAMAEQLNPQAGQATTSPSN